MAASTTRRGRRRTNINREPQNASNRDNSALRQRIANWQRQGREILNELFFSAADSALDITPRATSPVRVTSRTTSTEIVERPTAPATRRRRGRPAAIASTRAPATAANATDGRRRRRSRTLDTANLGLGNRVIDRVYNAMPPNGAINRQTLRETVSRAGAVRSQAIGAALTTLAERGIARLNGDLVERLRAAA